MYDKQCKTCKYKLSEFYKTGYLNCPDCYKSFREDLAKVIVKVQNNLTHRGKIPALSFEERELLNDYDMYLKAKDKALKEGNFKDVDKINRILFELAEELTRRGLM